MKKILLLLLTLIPVLSFGQDNKYGGTPVEGITPIPRVEGQNQLNPSQTILSTQTTPAPGSPTGTSQEVGVTQGQLSVSLTGAATYDIPIAVPPGINGVIPQIGLSYNSQGGNGLAGYGWNISGISSITRLPLTKSHDNTIDEVDYNNDRFALDGQRLLIKNGTSGTYGANGTVYETEHFSNLKITSYGIHPSNPLLGPAYFKVEYPDGSIAEYGNTSTSRTRTEWAITYWQNAQGVRITYDYNVSTEFLSISSIKYGSTYTTPGINEIQFVYKTRQRPEEARIQYIGGSIVRNTILSEIKVISSNIGYRNYYLAHDVLQIGYERLTSITEKTGDNTKAYNPTVFTYNTTSGSNVSLTTASLPELGNIRFTNSSNITGDFDGDGKLDFIIYPTIGTNAFKKYWIFNDLQEANPDYPTNLGYEVPVSTTFKSIFTTTYLNHENKLMPGNGWCVVVRDAPTNVTTFKNYGGSMSPVTPFFHTYDKTYTFPQFTYSLPACAGLPPNVWPAETKTVEIPKEYLSGDFNGDGLSDLIVIEKTSTWTHARTGCQTLSFTHTGGKTFFVDLDRRLTSDYVNEAANLTVNTTTQFQVADYNGDGKSDLWVFNTGGSLKIYTLNDAKQLVEIVNYTDTALNLARPFLVGDYNGDGKTDIVHPAGFGTTFYKFTATGTSFVKTSHTYAFSYNQSSYNNTCSDTHHLIPTDFNADGKTDIIRIQNSGCDGSIGLSLTYFANTSHTSSGFLQVSGGYNTTTGINHFAVPIFLDYSKPGSGAAICIMTNNTIRTFAPGHSTIVDAQLNSVTLGNGVKNVISYSPLVKQGGSFSSTYTPSPSIETYPNFDISDAPSLYVVSKLEEVTQTSYKQRLFKYYGAVSNVEGIGFQGFRATSSTNWYENNNQAITSITKYDVSKRGAISEVYTINSLYGSSDLNFIPGHIAKTTYSYSDELLPNKVYKIKTEQETSEDILHGTKVDSHYDHDEYNNITSVYKYSGNIGQDPFKVDIHGMNYDNQPSGATYYIGRLTAKSTEVASDEGSVFYLENYLYNNHLLIQKKTTNDENKIVTEDFEHDAFGNVTKKTVSTAGLASREEDYEYDTSGRFIKKVTDIEDLVTHYTYNQVTGLLEFLKNPYAHITELEYDKWGKNTKVKNYITSGTLTKELTTTYTVLPLGMAETTVSGSDGSSSYARFDDLGRTVISGALSISGWSYVKTEYDIYNRPVSVSEPYTNLNQSPTQFNTIAYDKYGRPTQKQDYTNKLTTFTYSGLVTTINDGVQTQVVTKDAVGNIAAKSDTGGDINYTYYPDGKVKEIDYDGYVTSFLYDGWGNKKQITDPSAGPNGTPGVYEYEYNDYGELKKITTPKGTTTYTINNVGKVTQKVDQGSGFYATTYLYYDAATKLFWGYDYMDSDGESHGWFTYYDQYARVHEIEETAMYTTYKKTYTYDAYSRIDTETLFASDGYGGSGTSATKQLKYEYLYGHRFRIFDNSIPELLWEASQVNARGQLVSANLGNGIVVNNTYDDYGFPVQFKHDKAGTTPVNIMTLTTTFNAQRGNLETRTNNLFSWTETFQYDALDRLKEFTNARGEQEIIEYDAKGRIEETPMGTNSFSQEKVYQHSGTEITNAGIAHYKNRVGIFRRTMEDKRGWTITSPTTTSYSTEQAKTGSYSLKMSAAGTQTVDADAWVNIDNSTTTQYTISAWVYFDGTSGPTARLYLRSQTQAQIDANSSSLNSVDKPFSPGWQHITFTYNAGSAVKRLSIRLNKSAAGTVYFDDVRIVKTADATEERKLNVTYNMFNDPVEITETGVDRISFRYNSFNTRSAIYYGSMASDIMARPYRKYYSADGSMEIKMNTVTNTVEFIMFLGGNGYNAPAVYKQKGAAAGEKFFLHRDYQGTIVAITNQTGNLIEKRLFDAWGNLLTVQDGNNRVLNGLTVLDRGYTGHEHLQSVNIIHMNGRLYDPVTHRFLQLDSFVQDPYNTQNYNRYAYVLNNPLKYTDPSGENYGDPINVGYYGPGESAGPSDGWGAFFVNLGLTIKENWGAIRGLQVGRAIDDAGTWVGNQVRSVNKWIDTNLRSIGRLFGLGRRKNENPTRYFSTPQMSNYQSTIGWQNDSFKGLPNLVDKFKSKLNDITESIKSKANDIRNNINKLASDIWNSPIARHFIKDSYSIGLSSNVTAFLGVGSTPLNVTFLTRGEAGLYMTPSVNVNGGWGVEANAGVSFGAGMYTGDPRNIKASHLEGHNIGVSVGLGLGLDASVGASYSPVDINNPISAGGYIQVNVFIGVGIEGSPVIVNPQINYQYTPKVVPLYVFE